ncbi:MAG: hypothetical protein WCI00_02365 [bacterium]
MYTLLKLKIHKITHPITVPNIAHSNHRLNISINVTIETTVTINHIISTHVLCLTFPVPAKTPKLITKSTLKIRNGHAYLSNSHEIRNFWPKNMVMISGHKTTNNPHILSAKIEKYL